MGATYANGLIRYDPAAGAIVRSYTYAADNPRSLPSNKVLSVFHDSADRIWATTFSAGFCLYDGQNDDFVVYDQALLGAGNLPSDINYRIVEDDSGNLWISTNKGLICFTPATLETKAYTTTDGLLNDEFNYNAGFRPPTAHSISGRPTVSSASTPARSTPTRASRRSSSRTCASASGS